METFIWMLAGIGLFLLIYMFTRNLYETDYAGKILYDKKMTFPRILYIGVFLISLLPIFNIVFLFCLLLFLISYKYIYTIINMSIRVRK